MIQDKERNVAEQVIRLHDGKSYSLLQEISMPPQEADDDGHITEDMYLDMCRDLDSVMGELISIMLIDCLVRKDSKLSLWKVKYSKSDDEVFWAVGFDRESLKVNDILVQW
ncbi:hypothetical protein A9Q99_19165 [Gammaproteobacteria bacterium 45_16_T64]|nr:hypothetical protein A9Q99_19165 [Gammaproteobacteria bacterium 45_16_T64]